MFCDADRMRRPAKMQQLSGSWANEREWDSQASRQLIRCETTQAAYFSAAFWNKKYLSYVQVRQRGCVAKK